MGAAAFSAEVGDGMGLLPCEQKGSANRRVRSPACEPRLSLIPCALQLLFPAACREGAGEEREKWGA